MSLLAGGTALGQGLIVCAAPVLTRLYSVSDFGYLQVYMSVMSFVVLAATLRYDQAILLPETDQLASDLLHVSLAAVAFTSLVTGLALFLFSHFGLVPNWLNAFRYYFWLVPVGMLGGGVYQAFSAWALRKKAYSRLARTKLTQVISQLIVQFAIGISHIGALGLLIGDVVGRANGSLRLSALWSSDRGRAFDGVTWASAYSAAKRYRKFPLVSTGSAMLAVAGYSIPPLLLAQYYGATVVGWFALGNRLLAIPTLLVGQAVSQVYSVELAKLSTASPSAMRNLFLGVLRKLAKIGALPFLVLLLFSPAIFRFAFGESWREAGVYVALLAAMDYVAFIIWPVMPTLNLLEKQGWQLAWDIGRLGLTLSSLWAAHHYGATPRIAILAFGLAMLIGYVAHLLFCFFAISRRARQNADGGHDFSRRVPQIESSCETVL